MSFLLLTVEEKGCAESILGLADTRMILRRRCHWCLVALLGVLEVVALKLQGPNTLSSAGRRMCGYPVHLLASSKMKRIPKVFAVSAVGQPFGALVSTSVQSLRNV